MTGTIPFRTRLLRIFRKPVETERLSLRHWTRTSNEKLAAYFNADNRDVMKQYAWPADKNYSPTYARFAANHYNSFLIHDGNEAVIGIFLKPGDDLIGELQIKVDAKGRDRMSYSILPSWRRQGLAGEAYDAALRHTFQRMAFDPRHAEIENDNTASRALLEKRGFKVTGPTLFTVTGTLSGLPGLAMERPPLQHNQIALPDLKLAL